MPESVGALLARSERFSVDKTHKSDVKGVIDLDSTCLAVTFEALYNR